MNIEGFYRSDFFFNSNALAEIGKEFPSASKMTQGVKALTCQAW